MVMSLFGSTNSDPFEKPIAPVRSAASPVEPGGKKRRSSSIVVGGGLFSEPVKCDPNGSESPVKSASEEEPTKPPKPARVPSRRKLATRFGPDVAPTTGEIHSAVDGSAFPPILDVHQAAALLQVSIHTVYRAVSEGRFKTAVRRGKPLRFWRDRLISEFFGAPPPPG